LQHGPLATGPALQRASIAAAAGEYFDRNQLPRKFWRMTISKEEMEIIESGGAAAWA
jgi:small subunit ribosomal protein YMR-31